MLIPSQRDADDGSGGRRRVHALDIGRKTHGCNDGARVPSLRSGRGKVRLDWYGKTSNRA
ncbi:hypothetical protein XFF6166_40015 [Xanthomonas citri pv. fuscans]|uniref:Transposase n=1 Tax=Xanthomonas campestris pv. phaseoli TaxID=317013 RepID=A0AB38E2Y5_XANCH|nr:hypothetical protein XFF6166_40015 [Xanthomonas citri pv. fuscans]SON85405.1 hypothetical protein XAP6984_660002 [Xanthomonas phaseoli pv. phaseoli]SON88180.1 hypothetical protein XAP412_610002 [Xanthomonas phaseoli pv. phaseoli]SON91719.1 hypothetical protein XAP7430_630002 [Xanthomonas phaseoli pv. phaseoli]SON96969.1 hypothetical protein XFF6990_40014 [Xanthomonas citri pv. fuscans]